MTSVFLLVIVLLSVGAYTAPTRQLRETDPLTDDDDDDLDDLDKILEKALLSNNTDNLKKIKAAFEVEPGSVKICVPLNYSITCTDQKECGNETTTSFNCTNGYVSRFTWTNFDAKSLSGYFLYAYASVNLEVFGFEWSGACNVSDTNTAFLNITIPSLPCTTNESTLSKALTDVTKKMPYYGNSSDSDKSYANQGLDETDFTVTYNIISVVFVSLALSLSIYTYFPIMNSLKSTKQYTPKAYFQFWAFQFFIIGYGIYFVYNNLASDHYNITIIVMLATVGGIALAATKLLSATKFVILSKMLVNNTPTQCCTGRFKKCCHYLLALLSLFNYFFLIAFIITVAPNVVLVYYLYPTRTLVRLPFIICAIIYINSLGALLIFQCERALYTIKSRGDNADNDDDDDDGEDYDVEKEIKYHKRFFYKMIKKSELYRRFYVVLPIITFLLLVVLILGVVILSDLTFHHNNNFQGNQLETLTALLPTFLLFFGTLYKRDLFIVDHKDEIEAKSEKEFLNEILQELKRASRFRGADIYRRPAERNVTNRRSEQGSSDEEMEEEMPLLPQASSTSDYGTTGTINT